MGSTKLVINGAEVKWAKVHQPEEKFPPARWTVDIFPTEADLRRLSEMGVPLKDEIKDDKPTGRKFVSAKRHTHSRKGDAIEKPRVVDIHGKPTTKLIGNGSKCNIIVDAYGWEYAGKKGTGLWLEAVQVVDLVEYEPAVDFEYDPLPSLAEQEKNGDVPF